MMFFRRRRKSLLGLVGLIALLVFLVNIGAMTGHSRQKSVAVLGISSGNVIHNSSVPAPVLITRPKEQEGLEAMDRLMSDRKLQVLKGCEGLAPNPKYLSSKVPIVNADQHFLHCPVTKAASTFWGRFLLTLNISGPMQSPFSRRLVPNARLANAKFYQLGSQQNRLQFLDRSFKSLFVREPFHRMFSAYVDKILGPNPYFWGEWGMYWRRLSHLKPSRRTLKAMPYCYHNLTFAQVMSVAAVTFYKSEMHFVPVSVRCHPCQFHYDFIGKMETFPQDLRHLSRTLNLSVSDYFSSKQFAFDYARDAIEDSINSPFGWLKNIFKCISKRDMVLRIWRKLQIRGLVDRRIQFPYTSEEEIQRVTGTEMIALALQAHRNSTDRAELQRQKREAFLEAFRTVDLRALEKIRDASHDDFVMFDYDPNPPDVFDRSHPLNVTGAFDWWRPWIGQS